jgi:threonine dehydrogenase-like Zn-dependent dehydrogenase
VGYQAHDPQGHEDNAATVNNLVSSVRFTGGIGTVGVYVPQDPGGPDELSQQGKARFDFGNFWFKGQQMGCGQAPVKRYNRHLRNLIAEDKATPSWTVSHDLPLEQGPDAYKHFDAREDGWTKVVLHPGQTA